MKFPHTALRWDAATQTQRALNTPTQYSDTMICTRLQTFLNNDAVQTLFSDVPNDCVSEVCFVNADTKATITREQAMSSTRNSTHIRALTIRSPIRQQSKHRASVRRMILVVVMDHPPNAQCAATCNQCSTKCTAA